MKKLVFITTWLLLLTNVVLAQNLYMPRDIKRAYNRQTRAFDGKPGKNYWQNHGVYAIDVTVQPPDRNIKGTELITYYNNSPDTLKGLNLKLIINIHRPGAARGGTVSPDYLTPGMQIDYLAVNGEQYTWNNEAAAGTNQGFRLHKQLLPHDSVKLKIDWHYQISLKSEREGMIDSTTYYLAYFSPRIAVYDDYNGWDRLPFTDFLEFYNDFNDYTLKVNVPKNYLVWATGTLQNATEVLQPQIANRLQQSFSTDSVIHVANQDEVSKGLVTAQKPSNTWVWTANNITDVALGISNHYVWDASSVVVDDATQRRASMQAAFLNTADDFHHSVQFGRNSLSWLSHNWPGVPYPYPKMTAFQGFADMEYPMMVNDSREGDLTFAQFVQDHEIAHTYFPFYMGINENRYGFMDEGWATTFELLIGTAEVGKAAAEKLYKGFRVNNWINDPSSFEDLPIITPSSELFSANGNNEYGKASLSYLALKDLLGDALFKKCLHAYMDAWHGKHPIPWDYFYCMSNASGKNLDWFFNNWFFNNYYIDLAITQVNKSGSGYKVTIDNIGGFATPFDLVITYADGSTSTQHQTPAVWEVNTKKAVIKLSGAKVIASVKIDGGIFMDANEKDNLWTAK